MNDQRLHTAYENLTKAMAPSPEARSMIERTIVIRRRRGRTAGAAAVASLAVGGAVALSTLTGSEAVGPGREIMPAATSAGLPSDDGKSELEWQTSIDGYSDDLVTVAERYENYAGAELVYDQRSLIVYGTGEPPPAVADLLTRAPTGVDAKWVSVPYSESQLGDAGAQLSKRIPDASLIRYAKDYGSIIVGVAGLPTSPAGMARLREMARQVTDIPVRFEEQPLAVPAAPGLPSD